MQVIEGGSEDHVQLPIWQADYVDAHGPTCDGHVQKSDLWRRLRLSFRLGTCSPNVWFTPWLLKGERPQRRVEVGGTTLWRSSIGNPA